MEELGYIQVNFILRLKDVRQITGLSRSTIYAYMAAGNFPQSIPLGVRAVGWDSREILQWLQARKNVIQFPEKRRRK